MAVGILDPMHRSPGPVARASLLSFALVGIGLGACATSTDVGGDPTPLRAETVRTTAEALSDAVNYSPGQGKCPNPNVNQNGGSVSGPLNITPVFWGPNVNPAITGKIQSYIQDMFSSGYLNWLNNEYGASAASNVFVTSPVTISNPPSGSFMSDQQIQVQILKLQGAQPSCSGSNAGPTVNSNIIYVLFMPSNVNEADNNGNTLCGPKACAYHYFASGEICNSDGSVFESINLQYAVIPDFFNNSLCTGTCNAVGNPSTLAIDKTTMDASHEIAEAMTDPYLNGWKDNCGNEIGDNCANIASTIPNGSGTISVQELWSNLDGECVTFDGPPWKANNLTRNYPGGTAATTLSDVHGYWGWDGAQHVNFVDAAGHVHELYWAPGGGSGWVDNDLFRKVAGGSSANARGSLPGSSFLAGYYEPINANQHVIFVDQVAQNGSPVGAVHELFFDHSIQTWKENDLFKNVHDSGGTPTAAATASSLNGYMTNDGGQHIDFVTSGGQVHELYWAPGASHWVENNLFGIASPPVPSTVSATLNQIDGYVTLADNGQHVNYIDTNTRHIHELFYNGTNNGGKWQDSDLTLRANNGTCNILHPCATPKFNFLTGYMSSQGSQHVDYIATNATTGQDEVHELYWAFDKTVWVDNNLFSLVHANGGTTGTPTGFSQLEGYAGSDMSQHVNYVDTNFHVHELFIPNDSGHWSDNDLFGFAVKLSPAVVTANFTTLNGYWGGPLRGLSYVDFEVVSDDSQHVNYLDGSGNVQELYYH